MTVSKPVGWTLTKPPPLSSLPNTPIPLPSTNEPLSSTPTPLSTHPPQIQARLLTSLSHHYPPEVYIPHLESFNTTTNDPWPNFVAACLTPKPCPQLSSNKALLRALNPPQCDEMLPEPLRGLQYKAAPPGYSVKIPNEPQRRSSNPSIPTPRKPAVGEVIRLGTNMQPTLSRRGTPVMKTTLPRVRSMFLSGKKSEKARIAEEKEREEADKERAEKEKAEKGDGQNEDNQNENGRREFLDLSEHGSDLDFTVRDGAEIERMEGMDDDMVRTQMDKESKPRHVGEIVKKMHSTTAGMRNIIAAETAEANLPALTDTGYVKVQRREELAKKRQEQAEAAREKERVHTEQRKEKFNRRRRRKLRKAGRIVQEESEEEETSPAPQGEASHSTQTVDCTNERNSQRPRIEAPPGRYEDHRSDDRYRGFEEKGRYDPRQYHPPPHDSTRYADRAPNWQSPQHYSHPPPPHYAPPSPYYASPSHYYNYHPPPYYPHHPPPPPPPHHYYTPGRAPPRLSRDEYEKRRRELYDKIDGICSQLHTDDARAIDDFLDNQDHMFRHNEKTKYFLLEQTPSEEVLLRIDRETRRWEVVRKGGGRAER